ncbi:hypothetical protein ACD591_18700 [Rufibacter glacialis]|uniref:DUF2292 domain-containing protein n=1 Tax=Rufibacter glacialis TaxID=1259555 RepID=A0ABV4RL96_9BACT|nr:hypothetical protein [Rufibacter glacialis]GGK88984.1 hypothetical protein GCM10011405_40890 [Rufibacter glacialis]
MEKEIQNTEELKNKILKGLDLAFIKLVKAKQKVNGELVFSQDGKIIRVKATDL